MQWVEQAKGRMEKVLQEPVQSLSFVVGDSLGQICRLDFRLSSSIHILESPYLIGFSSGKFVFRKNHHELMWAYPRFFFCLASPRLLSAVTRPYREQILRDAMIADRSFPKPAGKTARIVCPRRIRFLLRRAAVIRFGITCVHI